MVSKHLRTRELRFFALLLVTLVCVAGFLSSGLEALRDQTGGWRRVDMETLIPRIESGDLIMHEADWYKPVGKRPY